MIDQTVRITRLFDVYGDLLTERQKKCVEMHYFDDLSLSEVAEQFEVSRQAVHDILRRSVQAMEDFERRLGLVAKSEKQELVVVEIEKLVEQMSAECSDSVWLDALRKQVSFLR